MGNSTDDEVGFWQSVRAILKVARTFVCRRRTCAKAWALLTGTFVMNLCWTGVQLYWSTLIKQYNNDLKDSKEADFWSVMWVMFGILMLVVPLLIADGLLSGAFVIEWRRMLTEGLLADYFGPGKGYYKLKLEGKTIDNPDQRIGQDVAGFTRGIVALVKSLFESISMGVGTSFMLYHTSSELFFILLTFAAGSTLITGCIFARRLVNIERDLLKREATLRFSLVRTREHAESIAFLRGAEFERGRCREFFDDIVTFLYRRLFLLVTFSSITTLCRFVVFLLPAVVLAPKYFRGEVEFGDIGQASMLFQMLYGSLTAILDQLDAITLLGAQAVRVQQLREALDGCQGLEAKGEDGTDVESSDEETFALSPAAPGTIAFQELPGRPQAFSATAGTPLCLRLSSVELRPPRSDEALIESLSMALSEGESLIVRGESGIGKSSLLRAIGGLWSGGSGSIESCPAEEVFFLPQDPYLCLGSLRDNLLYPYALQPAYEDPDTDESSHEGVAGLPASDGEVRGALREANLGHLAERYDLDTAVDFDDVLSGGEKQRLSFARLLLRRNVRFAALDEATSALDETNEAELYSRLRERVPCFVSVGHRPSLDKFHSRRLTLVRQPKGGCIGQLT